MDYTRLFVEEFKSLQRISPQSTSTQVNGSAYVDVSGFARFVAKFNVGAIASTGTLTVQVRQATSAAGAGVKALIASAALADTGDDQDIWLEFKAEDLDVDGGFKFVRLEIVAATAASIVGAELLGFVSRFEPVVQPATVIASKVS